MKKLLLTISFFLTLAIVKAQVQTSYVVSSIAQMKTYYGTASKIYVVEKNSDYVICSPCVADEVNIYAGAGGRKWMKVSDSAKVDVTKLNGGTSNQVLTKNSGTDGDYSWQDNAGGGGIPAANQTVTATSDGQTTFTFTSVPASTASYNIYVNGCLWPDGWSASGNDIILTATDISEDDEITLVYK